MTELRKVMMSRTVERAALWELGLQRSGCSVIAGVMQQAESLQRHCPNRGGRNTLPLVFPHCLQLNDGI